MYKKIKKSIKRLIGKFNSITLKNKDFTIISNNCWGGFVYQKFSLEYRTPTIGLFFFAPDYIEFLENFHELIKKEIVFINADESKYKEELKKNHTFGTYPIGKLGDKVEIHFLHYHSTKEVILKWNKRLKRIDENNMLIKFCDRDLCTDDLIERFDKLAFKNKVCFTSKEYPNLKSVITFKEFEGKRCVEEEWNYYGKYMNIKQVLNKLEEK